MPVAVYALTISHDGRTRYHRTLLCQIVTLLRSRGIEVEELMLEEARERAYLPCRYCSPLE